MDASGKRISSKPILFLDLQNLPCPAKISSLRRRYCFKLVRPVQCTPRFTLQGLFQEYRNHGES